LGKYLEMKKITKRFNDNLILDRIDFSVEKGQVHAIVGENGAGKTTLMKILAGLYTPDSGEIFIDGKKVIIDSPRKAQDLGISMIYQEIRLFPDLNVTQNIFIKREPLVKPKWLRLINWDEAYRETIRYLEAFKLNINPRSPVSLLSLGQQKFVEIIKALSQKSNILIMDETTAALTESEIQLLLEAVRSIKKLGVAVIFISHRLEEIKQIADAVTVLRDGRVIRSSAIGEVDYDEIIREMAGGELKDRYPKIKINPGNEVLRVENLNYSGILKNINLEVRKGEIFGITGLSGSGRRTLAKVLFGINTPYEGCIRINGKTFKSISPRIAMKYGLCYVAGIGTDEGLIKQETVSKNITLTNLKRISKAGIISPSLESRHVSDLIERLEISARNKDIVGTLSGGKQKKVSLAKWLFNNAKILIIDEPTAGIDISSKVDIYNIINELAMSGASVIMISSDLSEAIGMCDRIAIMYNGEIRKTLDKKDATRAKIIHYASGGNDDDIPLDED
jgi:ribose transport system ATP-binding protein